MGGAIVSPEKSAQYNATTKLRSDARNLISYVNTVDFPHKPDLLKTGTSVKYWCQTDTPSHSDERSAVQQNLQRKIPAIQPSSKYPTLQQLQNSSNSASAGS